MHIERKGKVVIIINKIKAKIQAKSAFVCTNCLLCISPKQNQPKCIPLTRKNKIYLKGG